MKTQLQGHVSVPIPTSLFIQIVDFLRSQKDARDPVTAVRDAIDYWLDNADWKPELIMTTADLGYQWKNVFLPDKTRVRMPYKGQYFYADVRGDDLTYDGQSISPAQMANKIAGSSRNAWRDLWIKRPEDQEWRLADDLRREASLVTDKLS